MEPSEPSSAEKPWQHLAEALWARLSATSPAEQRRALRHGLVMGHPALFHLLVEESRRAEDPRRALELAELASATVEGSADALGEVASGLRFLAATGSPKSGGAPAGHKLLIDFLRPFPSLRPYTLAHGPRPTRGTLPGSHENRDELSTAGR